MDDIRIAKTLRNEVKKMVRTAKANFVQDYVEDDGTSTKKFWEKVQYVTKSSSKNAQINLINTENGEPTPYKN